MNKSHMLTAIRNVGMAILSVTAMSFAFDSSLAQLPAQTRQLIISQTEQQRKAPKGLFDDSIFKPNDAGLGLIICQPVNNGVSTDIEDFAVGCGLWLHWCVGCNPELGHTPGMENLYYPCQELNLSRPCFQVLHLSTVYASLGVTRTALGTITPAGTGFKITYQMYALPSRHPLGSPVEIHGTREQIVQQLPNVAVALLLLTGVKRPTIEPINGVTPDDFRALGHYRFLQTRPLKEPSQAHIDAVAARTPLASLLTLARDYRVDGWAPDALCARLLKSDSNNSLCVGLVMDAAYPRTPEFRSQLLGTVAKLAPGSWQALLFHARFGGTWEGSIPGWERYVRTMPRLPSGWSALAFCCEQAGDLVRHGRVTEALSRDEWSKLDGIYRKWQEATQKCVSLDPAFPNGWYKLAMAATFHGDSATADRAFWTAYGKEKANIDLLTWGLQMYQSKWGGDPRTLAKVAHLAAIAPVSTGEGLQRIADDLRSAGFPALAKTTNERAIEIARVATHNSPSDSRAHATLGYYLVEQERYKEALPELTLALKLDPKSDPANFQLGRLYIQQEMWEQSIPYFRASVGLTNGYESRARLGIALCNAGHLQEAEQTLMDLTIGYPSNPFPWGQYGWVLKNEKQYVAAVAPLRKAESLGPEWGLPHCGLCEVYTALKRIPQAIEEGNLAVGIKPVHADCHTALARALMANNDIKNAILHFRAAKKLAPDDVGVQYDLGEALIKNGQKSQGRTELERVSNMKNSGDFKAKAKDLIKKYP